VETGRPLAWLRPEGALAAALTADAPSLRARSHSITSSGSDLDDDRGFAFDEELETRARPAAPTGSTTAARTGREDQDTMEDGEEVDDAFLAKLVIVTQSGDDAATIATATTTTAGLSAPTAVAAPAAAIATSAAPSPAPDAAAAPAAAAPMSDDLYALINAALLQYERWQQSAGGGTGDDAATTTAPGSWREPSTLAWPLPTTVGESVTPPATATTSARTTTAAAATSAAAAAAAAAGVRFFPVRKVQRPPPPPEAGRKQKTAHSKNPVHESHVGWLLGRPYHGPEAWYDPMAASSRSPSPSPSALAAARAAAAASSDGARTGGTPHASEALLANFHLVQHEYYRFRVSALKGVHRGRRGGNLCRSGPR
jgi:hypothetical protein